MFGFDPISPEELAANESFRRWVLSGEPSDAMFWKEWIALYPDKQETVEQAVKLLELSEAGFNRITDGEIACELDRLSAAIENDRDTGAVNQAVLRSKWYYIAASVLLIVAAGWLFQRRQADRDRLAAFPGPPVPIREELVHETNPSGVARVIYLSDGSTVLLQPGSRLSYPAAFEGTKREVLLAGEAFFEVTKDPGRPFVVYAGALVTKVLGTSFKISAFEKEKNVTVVVKTGRVSVFPIASVQGNDAAADAGPKEGMILTPNQKIVYRAGELRLTRSLVEMPEVVEAPAPGQSFNFRGAPVSEVFEALARAYGVEIIFDQETMKKCYLTARLEDEPLFEKIGLICKTVGAEFEQMDGTIIISSQGCN